MDFAQLSMELIAGLGLFIYGMQKMADGLQKAAGDKMRRLLEILTSNPIAGVLVGTGVTAIIQSSSATTVMVVGFVNAGLMTLKQAIGVVLGANIGTTVTTQLVSFKLTKAAPLAIGLGMVILLVAKKRQTRNIGQILLGFGILFFGMKYMGDAMKPLRTYEPFITTMTTIGERAWLGLLLGAGFTALVQSSSATTAIVVALALQGLIDLPNALPLILGSNIGTTVTALLASINTTVTARRAAIAHFFFNVGGSLLFLVLLKPFTVLAAGTSTEAARQIANAHTIFNVINTLIVLPFIGPFAVLVTKLVPGKDLVSREQREVLYLDRKMLSAPSIALGQATRELLRMGEIASSMLVDTHTALETNSEKHIALLQEKEDLVNFLEKEITDYLVVLSAKSLSSEQSRRLNYLLETVNDIERVGDHAQNVAELAEAKIEHNLPFSDLALGELKEMFDAMKRAFDDSLGILESPHARLAQGVMELEDKVDQMEKDLRKSHIDRLSRQICNTESGIIFLDVISNYERIADHASSIARNGTEL